MFRKCKGTFIRNKINCNITKVNVFTITDQFNVSLVNKSFFYFFLLTDLKHLNSCDLTIISI